MTNDFILSFAASHFRQRPRQPLLSALAGRLGNEDLITALCSGCRPLQHRAWQRLVECSENQIDSLVLKKLSPAEPEFAKVVPPLLAALSHHSVPLSDECLARIALLLDSPDVAIRRDAAKVVALRQPESAIAFFKRGGPIDSAVFRSLCLADDPTLIEPLMQAFGFPGRQPPLTIGFLVTPTWLADHHSSQPELVETLIRCCGYCEDPITAEVLNLLSSGFSYVTPRMTNEPRLTKIAHRWLRRIRAFVWRLLPDELELARDDDRTLDTGDALEMDLFLAAVRDSDRMAFLEQKQWPPFSRQAAQKEPAPTCFHATSNYVRRLVVEQPLAWADRWEIPHARRGDFLIERARVLLEPNVETRTTADLAFRGRWVPGIMAKARSPVSRLRDVQQPLPPRALVIGEFTPPLPNDRLSPGANSIVTLAAACGLDGSWIADWLSKAETQWSRLLVPIGIEVQIPHVDPDHFAAWKDALPYLGVPSPIRTEFGGMVEAAFRPARSFHAMAFGPLLLVRLGLIAEPQDMALHISLQGNLDAAAGSIAFPHHFIHPSTRLRNRPDRAMSRVMSKGFVHVHDDAEVIEPGMAVQRTEFRLFRLFADSQTETSNMDPFREPPARTTDPSHLDHSKPMRQTVDLNRGFIGELVSVQILGSAALSECQQCREVFRQYSLAVEHAADLLPAEFRQLLDSNYFESTGDPSDETLLSLLPIFRRWSAVRHVVRADNLSSALDQRFRTLRNYHVEQVILHWQQDHGLIGNELAISPDEIRVALPSLT